MGDVEAGGVGGCKVGVDWGWNIIIIFKNNNNIIIKFAQNFWGHLKKMSIMYSPIGKKWSSFFTAI